MLVSFSCWLGSRGHLASPGSHTDDINEPFRHTPDQANSNSTLLQTPLSSHHLQGIGAGLTLHAGSPCRCSATSLGVTADGDPRGTGLLFLPWGRAHRRGATLHGESVWAPHLIARGRVYFRCQGLGFGLGGKEVLGFVEAEAQDLSIQVVILISELVILLRRGTQATLDSHRDPLLCIRGLLTSPPTRLLPPGYVSPASSGHPRMTRPLPGSRPRRAGS